MKPSVSSSSKLIRGFKAVIFLKVLLLLAGYIAFQVAGSQAQAYANAGFSGIDSLNDGYYHGEYKAFGIKKVAEVEFEVKNGQVEKVDLKKLVSTPGHQGRKEILYALEEEKDLTFDAVSGATRSSYFARAAVTNAIKKEKK